MKYHNTLRKRILITCCALFFATALSAAAQTVPTINLNRPLENEDLFTRRLSLQQIQMLLGAKGALGSMTFQDASSGGTKSAADVFYAAQQQYGIHAGYLISTAQKESSIITAQNIRESQLSWTMGFGVCDSCSTSDPQVQQYKGFENQIMSAAKQNQRYPTGNYRYKVGGTYTISNQRITMENQAAVNMYLYTPHVHGNQLVARIYKTWFQPVLLPAGTVVQVNGESGGGVYLVAENNVLRPYRSRAAFVSNRKYDDIVKISKDQKALFTMGPQIRFANASLVGVPDGTVYLVRNTTLYPFASRKDFAQLGFNMEEVQQVPASDISGYAFGTAITASDVYPGGALLQNAKTGGVYYVEQGTRYALPHREYLRQLSTLRIRRVTEAEILKLKDGGKMHLKEGTLVKADSAPEVYMITAEGKKRWFDTAETFNTLGYNWKNIVIVNARTLAEDIHPTGDPITLNPISTADVQTAATK